MRVTMLQTHNFIVPETPQRTVRYREGRGYTVKRDWGDALVALGVAKEAKAPKRKGRPENLGDWDGKDGPGGDAAAAKAPLRPPVAEGVEYEVAAPTTVTKPA